MSQQDSCYSTDQQYFLDLCRGNQFEQLKQFISSLPQVSQFNWGWFNNSGDNFIHMIAANNLPQLFDYILPVLEKRCPKQQILQIVNKQNSSRATPLHYAVITNSKDMVNKLLQAGANPQITNQQNRTPLEQAQKFQKYQIAEMLAPLTKTDIQALKTQLADVKLNNDNDDSDSDQQEEQKKEPLKTIQQEKQDNKQETIHAKNKEEEIKQAK